MNSNSRLRHSHGHGHTKTGEGVEHHSHEHSHATRGLMEHQAGVVHQNNHHSKEELMDVFGRRPARPPADTRSDEERDRLLLEGMLYALDGKSPSLAIEAQERRGQEQLVASQVLPNPTQRFERDARAEIEALGVVFGEPVEGDPLFVQATLPDGWARRGSEHDMWSYVVDERGEERIAVFYKAAFYDRKAAMHAVVLCVAVDCRHSSVAHPYVGRAEKASADNDWSPANLPEPCTRDGCGCLDFKRAAKEADGV